MTVLMAACGIDPAARSAFAARVRQLQRLGMPPHREGRADGPAYGLAELTAFATAVRLMAAFMVPSLAARYVIECWPRLAPALLAGAREALPVSYLARRPLGNETVIVIAPSALHDLGRQGRHDERYAGTLGDIAVVSPASAIDAARRMGGGVVLDTTAFMPKLVAGFVDAAIATEQDTMLELDLLRFATWD
ncbi:hypothetical protein [Sphingomonas sp. BK345]|uniref:hypothetical protein n=1 Tax=Sphingomonas sp. BK345 TaxID=2586980 RepID=UPI001617911B|nr:hypothetical protein [Sphingomonas sp. BK345]MBB3472783.1 hypothetical protein [Sphingomonas sp. BK345]